MYLPSSIENRGHAQWNHLVSGLMEAWEVAERLGLEENLWRHMENDPDGTLAEILGTLGAESVMLAKALKAQLQEAAHDKSRRTAALSRILREDAELSVR